MVDARRPTSITDCRDILAVGSGRRARQVGRRLPGSDSPTRSIVRPPEWRGSARCPVEMRPETRHGIRVARALSTPHRTGPRLWPHLLPPGDDR